MNVDTSIKWHFCTFGNGRIVDITDRVKLSSMKNMKFLILYQNVPA